MKKLINVNYSKSILPFFILSIFIVILTLHFANITRKIEKENYNLKINIIKIEDQININEIEYSLYNSYEYLDKLKKIYFENSNNQNYDNRITFSDFQNIDLQNLYTVGIE